MIKHITPDETKNYILLDKTNPKWIDYVVAFTRIEDKDGWEKIEYYGKKQESE